MFELTITAKDIDAFVADPARMLYRLRLRDPGGTLLTCTGYELIRNEAGFDVWLCTTILRGHVPPPEPAAAATKVYGRAVSKIPYPFRPRS